MYLCFFYYQSYLLRYILHILIYIRLNSYLYCKNTLFVKISSFLKFLFPSQLPGWKSEFSCSRPKLREWFLVHPVPVQNTGKAFLFFPFMSPNAKSDCRLCLGPLSFQFVRVNLRFRLKLREIGQGGCSRRDPWIFTCTQHVDLGTLKAMGLLQRLSCN